MQLLELSLRRTQPTVVQCAPLLFSAVEMGLNIKNEETCRLAGELARLTNTTKTGAVRQALRERLERETKRRGVEARLYAMRRSAERCAALMGPGVSSGQHGDMLYDDRGLPK